MKLAIFLIMFCLTTTAVAATSVEPYVWRNVTIKGNGFIDGIVYSTVRADLIFVHTDMGGAYRWDEPDHHWTPLNDFSSATDPSLKNLGVETMAADPTDANVVYMACGTYMSRTAILRSNDCGKTWKRAEVPFRSNGNGVGRSTGERMVIDPNQPRVLFYGTRADGLWRSADAGVTWLAIKSFPTNPEAGGVGKDVGIIWLRIDPTSSKTIYAARVVGGAGLPRIFRSTDGGDQWEPLPGGQPVEADTFPQRAALSADGRTLLITYASSRTSAGPYGLGRGFVKRVDDPGSADPRWSDITPPAPYAFDAIALGANSIYVGELGDYNPSDRIWRSTDGGKSWTAIHPQDHRDDSTAPFSKSIRVHWLGDLQINPHDPDDAMFTTGFGLFRTRDLTGHEPTWHFFNDGLEQTAVLGLSSPNRGDVHLFSAIGDRDGYRHADFNVSPPAGLFGQNNGLNVGTCDQVEVAWEDADQLVRLTRKSPFVQSSSDNGVTWRWMPNSNARPAGRGTGSVAISADGRHVVYQPKGGGPVLCSERADEWSTWSESIGGLSGSVQLVSEVAEPKTFFAYGRSGVARSTDGGHQWTAQTANAPAPAAWVRCVPGHPNDLLVAARGQGLWCSMDAGVNWSKLASGTVTSATAIGVGAGKSSTDYPAIFIAGVVEGQSGFFRSDDQGQHWIMVSDADHQYGEITVIQGDPRVYGRVYVGANGRGILFGEPAK